MLHFLSVPVYIRLQALGTFLLPVWRKAQREHLQEYAYGQIVHYKSIWLDIHQTNHDFRTRWVACPRPSDMIEPPTSNGALHPGEACSAAWTLPAQLWPVGSLQLAHSSLLADAPVQMTIGQLKEPDCPGAKHKQSFSDPTCIVETVFSAISSNTSSLNPTG